MSNRIYGDSAGVDEAKVLLSVSLRHNCLGTSSEECQTTCFMGEMYATDPVQTGSYDLSAQSVHPWWLLLLPADMLTSSSSIPAAKNFSQSPSIPQTYGAGCKEWTNPSE